MPPELVEMAATTPVLDPGLDLVPPNAPVKGFACVVALHVELQTPCNTSRMLVTVSCGYQTFAAFTVLPAGRGSTCTINEGPHQRHQSCLLACCCIAASCWRASCHGTNATMHASLVHDPPAGCALVLKAGSSQPLGLLIQLYNASGQLLGYVIHGHVQARPAATAAVMCQGCSRSWPLFYTLHLMHPGTPSKCRSDASPT